MTSLIHEDTVTLLNVIKNGRVNLEGGSVGNQSEHPLYSESKTGNICYQTEALSRFLSKINFKNYFLVVPILRCCKIHCVEECGNSQTNNF